MIIKASYSYGSNGEGGMLLRIKSKLLLRVEIFINIRVYYPLVWKKV